MSDHSYEYVECNCCSFEARKKHDGIAGFGGRDLPPAGWLVVANQDSKKLWDICPECAKAFTEWLLKRAGDLAGKATP